MLVLVADDDRDAAETLAALLRALLPPPVEIVLAFDGQEAVAAATVAPPRPEAVIMDVEMPRMNGVSAAIAIRRSLGSESPTIIAVSGHAELSQLATLSSAFDHALAKPVNVHELLRLLPLT